MKVKCVRSCSGPGINLAFGREYDLTAEQIKAVGASVEVIETKKPAPKKAPAKAAKKK